MKAQTGADVKASARHTLPSDNEIAQESITMASIYGKRTPAEKFRDLMTDQAYQASVEYDYAKALYAQRIISEYDLCRAKVDYDAAKRLLSEAEEIVQNFENLS